MTGLNLSIKSQIDGITKPYGILYSEINTIHIAQVFDETCTVEKQIFNSSKEDCIKELTEYLNSIGTITSSKVNTPDDFLIESINRLKSNETSI